MSQTEVAHMDSTEEVDQHNSSGKKQKSRRPANTAFRQQRLKAWQPILTPKTVLPIFFAIGIIFAPIGGLLLWSSAMVQELSIDYTTCASQAGADFSNIPSDKYSSSFKSSNATRPRWKVGKQDEVPPYGVKQHGTTVCTLLFDIPNDIGPPVLLYYRLTNFYQNHRRYVKSLDTSQLNGNFISNSTISTSSCDPIKLAPNGKAYYPCGLIANSLFNDTIRSPVALNSNQAVDGTKLYSMTSNGTAWSSDAQLYSKTAYTRHQVMPPPNWKSRYPDGYTAENDIPDLSKYEEFQVWMRTAGLPTFSKLALRNDHDVMTAGTYQIQISDYFPVTIYGGTKSVLISTRTVMGGKNPFLGIAYVVVGGLCIVLGVVFTIAHLLKPRKLGDHTYLSWNNNDATSTGITTGREARPGQAEEAHAAQEHAATHPHVLFIFDAAEVVIDSPFPDLKGLHAVKLHSHRPALPITTSGMTSSPGMFVRKALRSCLLSCLLSITFPGPTLSKPTTPHRHCPVDDPSDHLRASHAYLHQAEPLENDLWNASSLKQLNGRDYHHRVERQATNPYYTIDTYFHVVSDTASASPTSANYVTDDMITNQFDTIASAYTNANIGYRYQGVTRTVNSSWATNGDDLAMKTALRRGTYSSLNVYFQSELQSAPGTPGVPAGSVLLGYCSLPSAGITPTTPESEYTIDGCNILSSTMPGGSFQQYNEGGTAVHEIGHWNGLLHPFQDNTCATYDYGDYVADTPQELTSTTGCPTSKDTCPNSGVPAGYDGTGGPDPYGPQGYSGPDPIHNYMDYSTDACYTGFTAGQGARMLNIWDIYRAGL